MEFEVVALESCRVSTEGVDGVVRMKQTDTVTVPPSASIGASV